MFNYDEQGELFALVTDALQSGPGTEVWARAIEAIGASDPGIQPEKRDESQALLAVRAELEALKSEHLIQPSQRLTEAVLAGVASQAAEEQRSRFRLHQPTAKTIAGLAAAAAMVILAVGALVVQWILFNNGDSAPAAAIVLNSTRPQLSGKTQEFESLVPPGWHPIGPLRVKAEKGLRLAGGEKHVDQSGGILRTAALPTKPFEVDAKIHYVGGAGIGPELFISDETDFDDNRPTDKLHELSWVMSDKMPGIRLPDSTVHEAVAMGPLPSGHTVAFDIKMKFNGTTVTVETSTGERFSRWKGAAMLDPQKPWHVGLRFVIHNQNHNDCVSLESICVHEVKESAK